MTSMLKNVNCGSAAIRRRELSRERKIVASAKRLVQLGAKGKEDTIVYFDFSSKFCENKLSLDWIRKGESSPKRKSVDLFILI